MDGWEFKCISIWGGGEKTGRVLGEYGSAGWELVCVWSMWHNLKRRLARATWNRD